MKALKKVVRGVTLAELWATALTFVIMVVCYFISVVNRNFIKGSMPWTEELALYCMVYMALIGTELGLRDGTQVSVTALTEKLKGTMVGKVINFIAKVALIVFSCTMLQRGPGGQADERRSDHPGHEGAYVRHLHLAGHLLCTDRHQPDPDAGGRDDAHRHERHHQH